MKNVFHQSKTYTTLSAMYYLITTIVGFYQRTGEPLYKWSDENEIIAIYLWPFGFVVTFGMIFFVIPVLIRGFLPSPTLFLIAVYALGLFLLPYVLVYGIRFFMKHF